MTQLAQHAAKAALHENFVINDKNLGHQAFRRPRLPAKRFEDSNKVNGIADAAQAHRRPDNGHDDFSRSSTRSGHNAKQTSKGYDWFSRIGG